MIRVVSIWIRQTASHTFQHKKHTWHILFLLMGFGNEEQLKIIAWTTVNGFEKRRNKESILIVFDGNGGQCVNIFLFDFNNLY